MQICVILYSVGPFPVYNVPPVSTKIVSRAKRHLKAMNEELVGLNKNLDEANLIKEKYVGYFMNQCAVYINKLDEYRKNVNRKIKTGQIDDLYKSSSRPFEKELEELYQTLIKRSLNCILTLWKSSILC